MATAPRFPTPVEHRLLKGACNLPPRLQRRLFGRRRASTARRWPATSTPCSSWRKLSGVNSYTGGLPPAEARELNRASAASAAARPPIPMARIEELEIPGAGGAIPARSYLPHGVPAGAPAALLVYFHGGGWVVGDLETHDDVCRFLAASAGVAVLSIAYRLAPEHPFPAAVEDALAAFLWAAENADALGIDPGRIARRRRQRRRQPGGRGQRPRPRAGGAEPGDAAAPLPRDRLHLRAPLPPDVRRGLPADQGRHGHVRVRVPARRHRRGATRGRAYSPSPISPAFRPPTSRPPGSTRCATRARRSLLACATPASRPRCAAIPGLIHGFANQTAISRTARGAMREAAGALRMGLAARSG